MRRFYAPVIILFAACFLTASFPPEASALQWEFKSAGDLSGWTILDAGSARIENGSLALSARKGVAPRLISPPAIEAPFRAGRLYLSMTVSSRAGGRAEALITSDGTRIYSKTFEFRGNGYEEAGVYLGDILPEGARVRQFAVDFYADDVSIRAIRLEEPTLWQTVGAVNRRFWEPEEASIGTVNFIDSPDINGVSFLAVLYGVTAVVFSAAILFLYLKRGRVTGQALIKYMAFAFLASGLLFSVRMDYNWLHAARSDLNNLTGNTMRGRISTVYKGGLDDFLNFMDLVKKTVPENGVVKAAAKGRYGLYSTLGSYYLLPLRTSGKADYLWTYMDSGLRFSRERRALLKGDEVAAWPIRLVMEYGPDAAIYRIEKD